MYRKSTHTIESLEFNGKPVTDDMIIKIGLQHYHFKNFDEFFGVPMKEVEKNMKPKTVPVPPHFFVIYKKTRIFFAFLCLKVLKD